MENEILKSAHVTLAALRPEDSPTLFQWINDRELVLFNSAYRPVSQGEHDAWFESIRERSDVFIFGIRLCETDQLIGSCQLHSINSISRSAELQIRLGVSNERGKGYGTEAVKLLLQFAFSELNLHRVYLHVFATNPRAIQVYEKCGFVREGLLREAAFIDDRFVDVLVMGILREEYGRQ
jgi:RimJ/RimL family protein N-acetyltransferase